MRFTLLSCIFKYGIADGETVQPVAERAIRLKIIVGSAQTPSPSRDNTRNFPIVSFTILDICEHNGVRDNFILDNFIFPNSKYDLPSRGCLQRDICNVAQLISSHVRMTDSRIN